MLTAECTQVDLMTVPDMEENIDATSDLLGAVNVIFLPGQEIADYWSPSPTDMLPALQVFLPVVFGIPPEDYEVMAIRITAQNFISVLVTFVDSDGQYVFSVSIFSSVEILSIY